MVARKVQVVKDDILRFVWSLRCMWVGEYEKVRKGVLR